MDVLDVKIQVNVIENNSFSILPFKISPFRRSTDSKCDWDISNTHVAIVRHFD